MNINLKNYHQNDLLLAEYEEANKELDALLKDATFDQEVKRLFLKYDPKLYQGNWKHFLAKLYVAHDKECLNKENIKQEILSFLPIQLLNRRYLVAPRSFILEPNNAATFNSSMYLVKKLSTPTLDTNPNRVFLRSFFVNILRSLSSCFILFEMGDDPHAFSLLRGFIEQEIKLCILIEKPETMSGYRKFIQYNSSLQNGIETQEMKDLFSLRNVYSKSEKENFLLYGWSSSTSKVMSFRRLLEIYSPEHAPKIYQLFSDTSEFVHEDYLGVNYDFIYLRKKYSDYLTIIFFKFLYPLICKTFSKDYLVLEGIHISKLINTDLIKNELKQSIPFHLK